MPISQVSVKAVELLRPATDVESAVWCCQDGFAFAYLFFTFISSSFLGLIELEWIARATGFNTHKQKYTLEVLMWPRREIVVLLYIIAFFFSSVSIMQLSPSCFLTDIKSNLGEYIFFCNFIIHIYIYKTNSHTNDEPLVLTFSARILTPWSRSALSTL